MNEKQTSLTRREFIATGGAAAAATAFAWGNPGASPDKRLRLALVGTGDRGSYMWGQSLVEDYSDVAELVGLCDINSKRVKQAQKLIGTSAPTYHMEFDRMVKETRPDAVVVTTPDATHYHYVIRALELGVDAISEKSMCTEAKQCQAILDAQKRTGRKVTVTFNARHGRADKKVKEHLMEKAVGDVISVDFHEYLNTSHGADYFRRWHRLKENSGTLLCHKASHHFDQANWWLDADPVEVVASGDLKFYGRNHDFRSTHCRACPYAEKCPFYWDITKNERYVKLYVECESEDGYLRDRCVWSEDTNIYDVMSVIIRYNNGVRLSYTANTYLPFEGQAVSFNGTKGRLDYKTFTGGGYTQEELRLTPIFKDSELIAVGPKEEGEHGGADKSLKDMLFRGQNEPDPLGLKAGLRAGAMSSLIGIAAYTSIERDSERVRISDLVKL